MPCLSYVPHFLEQVKLWCVQLLFALGCGCVNDRAVSWDICIQDSNQGQDPFVINPHNFFSFLRTWPKTARPTPNRQGPGGTVEGMGASF